MTYSYACRNNYNVIKTSLGTFIYKCYVTDVTKAKFIDTIVIVYVTHIVVSIHPEYTRTSYLKIMQKRIRKFPYTEMNTSEFSIN